MTTFVQIVVNVPAVSGIFDYSVPEPLLGQVGVGHLVIAPFGKQTVQGVVFRFMDKPSVPDVKEIMELVAPSGPMYQAGTLSGNPLAMTAGIVTLNKLKAPETWQQLEQAAAALETGLASAAQKAGVTVQQTRVGTMFTTFWSAR